MGRVRLTAGRIRDFQCPDGKAQAFMWDSDVPGLAVRATGGGGKAFIFQGRINGESLRVTIGDVRTWGIDEVRDNNGALVAPGARQEARRMQAAIDQGIDPRQQKAERIAQSVAKRAAQVTQATTVGSAWDAYVAACSPKWGELHRKSHEQVMQPGGLERPKKGRRKGQPDKTLPGMVYPLAAVQLRDLDAGRVGAWMDECNARGKTQAGHAFRLLRAFLRWCSEHTEYKGLVEPDACLTRAVRDKVQAPQAKSDCLQREQLKPWFEQVRGLANKTISAYLQILLLSGARREELAALRWEDVDFQWKTITIRDKVEGTRTIPLTPYVGALLREVKGRNDTPPPSHRILHGKRIPNDLKNWKPSPWVFSSARSESGRLADARAAHERALAAAAVPVVTLHGLRRSFGTLAEWVECPAGISAQIMGHKPSALAEKHYRRRPIDLLRVWHTKIESWMLDQAGIKQPEESVAGLRVVA